MRNRILSNALWIIVMQCIKALITVGVSMLTTRFLGPSNYGLINYAASIVSFVAPLMYLGYNNTLVRELVHHPEDEGEILGSAIGSSLLSSVICVAMVVAFVSVANAGEKTTLLVCGLYSTLLIFQSIDLLLFWFQAKLMSKYSAIASLCAYIIVAAYKVCILVFGKDVYWLAVSSAIEYMLVSLILLIVYKRLGGKKLKFSFSRVKRMLNSSKFYIVASMMVSVSAYIDRIMIKLMINDTVNGYYSAAVTCAAMATFVFVAIIDSFRPEIVEHRKKDKEKFRQLTKMMYSTLIYLSLAQCVVFFLLAEPIVKVICGADYGQTVPLLRLVVWYTPFSYLAAARNVWILAEQKERYLWIINLTSAVVNIVSNLILIPLYGAMGAAIASLISNIIAVVVMCYVIKPLRGNCILMFQGLDPRLLTSVVRNMAARIHMRIGGKKG